MQRRGFLGLLSAATLAQLPDLPCWSPCPPPMGHYECMHVYRMVKNDTRVTVFYRVVGYHDGHLVSISEERAISELTSGHD
jgi:hypothetical protein